MQPLLSQAQLGTRPTAGCLPGLLPSRAEAWSRARRPAALFSSGRPSCPQTTSIRRGQAGLCPAAALPAASPAVLAAAAAEPWSVLAVLCSCAAAAQAAEQHTSWGRLLSAPLLTLLLALGAASLGLLPASSGVYDVVWSHLLPLAVALFLLDHDVSDMRRAGGPVLVAFLTGAVAMLAGAAVAWMLCKSAMAAAAGSTAAAAQLAACLVASYIGGSVNFIAVAAATQLPTALVPGAMAADNLGMLLLLGLLMAVPLRWLQQQQWQRRPQLAPVYATSSSGDGSSGDGSSAAGGPSLQQAAVVAAVLPGVPSGPVCTLAPAPLGLDGSPLLTQPPLVQEVTACLEATSKGSKAVRRTPGTIAGGGGVGMSGGSSSSSSDRLPAVGSSSSNGATTFCISSASAVSSSSSNGTGGSNGASMQASSSAVAVAVKEEAAEAAGAAAAGVGKCGGCRASGVTALDEHPLLTRAPGMGDAITTIAAARQGKQQVLTPPQPAAVDATQGAQLERSGAATSTSAVTKAVALAPAGSSGSTAGGYDVGEGPDGLMAGCGCCAEALDAIAAASPAPASLLAGAGGSSAGAAATAAGAGGSNNSGALALDGSLLLTEEPDGDRLAAAVAAARSGGSSGSSVAVSPLDSGEFELLVTLDKDSLLQRLREQEQKQQRARKRDKKQARIVAVDASIGSSMDSSSSSGGESSMEERSEGSSRRKAATAVPLAYGGNSSSAGALTATTAAAALAAAACASAAAHHLAGALNSPALHQLLLGGIAVAMSAAASVLRKNGWWPSTAAATAAAAGPRSPFAGSSQLAQVLIGVFFAALGASCCCPLSTLACCAPLLGFVAIMTATHWALLWGMGGRLLGLQPEVLLCGSAAAIGGPATAAGLAAARGWGRLVQPSLLCGSLGYALGTGAGLLVAQGLGVLP